MNFYNLFFSKFAIDGIAKNYDAVELKFLDDDNFKSCDLVFLFKALDSFEFVKHDVSKDILKRISAKRIVVSFPTKSLVSKQVFKIEKRNWLFNFLERQGWSYSKFEVDNELFVLIDKS